jgi:hypothetical protein
MRRTPDLNHFWVELNGLDADKPYIFQYLVDGEIRIGDPYCERVSDPGMTAISPLPLIPA